MKVKAVSLSAQGQVGQENAAYHGYSVTTVTAVGAINIRKGSLTGVILDHLPAATAAGSSKDRSNGVACDAGLFVEFVGGATGTLTIFFE